MDDFIYNQYDIPKDSNIILNIGTGEKRKGLDIFYEVSQKFISENYIFIWVGLITEEMEEYIETVTPPKTSIFVKIGNNAESSIATTYNNVIYIANVEQRLEDLKKLFPLPPRPPLSAINL